jgi:hypothetical protein
MVVMKKNGQNIGKRLPIVAQIVANLAFSGPPATTAKDGIE